MRLSREQFKAIKAKQAAKKAKAMDNAEFIRKMNGKAKAVSRKALVKRADDVFSLAIRARDLREFGKCPLCKKRDIACCFHFITRANHKTRWDSENAIGSCMPCNYAHEYRPHTAYQWFIKRHGLEKWDAMVERSSGLAKFSNADLQAMIKKFQKGLNP